MVSCCFPRVVSSRNPVLNIRTTTVQDSISLKDILLSISTAYEDSKRITFLTEKEFVFFQDKVNNNNCTAFNSLSVFIDGKS